MPTFRMSFRSAQPDELVEADDVRTTATSHQFVRVTTVIGRPRTVVVRRLLTADVDEVVMGPDAAAAL